MIQKIESYMKENHMIEMDSHVIVGLSGGADSVCLLLVLLELRERMGYTLSAVHVEHGIRGAESLSDAEFVKELCARFCVPCSRYSFSVPEYAAEHHMGEEEAGRKLRYRAFEQEREKLRGSVAGNVYIAVAHHIDDNAETMLFHLARGAGIRGLSGIAPVRGAVIRPLLAVGRQEIESYLLARNQQYCTDGTNQEDQYTRNKIRHHVMPALRQVNARAAEHMQATAAYLRLLNGYICQQTELAEKECTVCSLHGIKIIEKKYQKLDVFLRGELLADVLADAIGGHKNIERAHISRVQELFGKQVGRSVVLPGGLRAVRDYDGVEIIPNGGRGGGTDGDRQLEKKFSYQILEVQPDNGELQQDCWRMWEEDIFCKKKYTKCFDYDKIKNSLCIRHRQPGDFLTIDDVGHTQKLKKYFVNEKIPEEKRDTIPLLADGDHVVWVVGHRISSYYKVSQQTKKVLRVEFYGGEKDE